MDLKKEAAHAALKLLKNPGSIGLGAGSTIAWLVGFLKEALDNGLQLSIYTSSEDTASLLQKKAIPAMDIAYTDRLDQYFDSCDQLDYRLNALKSGAGIHTSEKLLASMASEFILLADESKIADRFDAKYPLVLEVLPQATCFVSRMIRDLFPVVSISVRKTAATGDSQLTRYGNWLLDCFFAEWPEPARVQQQCKAIPGIVEISLFYQIAARAIIASPSGILLYEKQGEGISSTRFDG